MDLDTELQQRDKIQMILRIKRGAETKERAHRTREKETIIGD